MIDQSEEPSGEQLQDPHMVGISVETDSVRMLKSPFNTKCVIVVDITNLNDKNQQKFAERAMAALIRMADKLPVEKGGNEPSA